MPEAVTHWIDLLKTGDSDGVGPLWEHYFARLVELARLRLRGVPCRAADEEDVASSVFAGFCRDAMAGRFPNLADSSELWKLLVVLTARKAADLVTRERCAKRGGGAVRGESAFLDAAGDAQSKAGIDEVIGSAPTPEFALQVAEECQRLLDCLGDDTLRTIAGWKLDGYTNQEIKSKLGCSLATVERKLARIRRAWERQGAP